MKSLIILVLICAAALAENPTCSIPDTVPPTGESCPEDNGTGFPFNYADPDHCSEYWQCINGCVKSQKCPGGYLFDEVPKICEQAIQVYCGDRDCDNEPCQSPPSFICPAPNGDFPDPDNCIKYMECTNSVPVREICPLDSSGLQLWFDAATNLCADRYVADCNGVQVCTQEDESCADADDIIATTTTTTVDPDAFKCPEEYGYFEDPENCIKYYNCIANVPERLTCGTSGSLQLHWDSENIWCDYPENVDCYPRPICDANDENCEIEPTTAPNECDAVEDGCSSAPFVPLGPCDQCYCQCTTGEDATKNCCQDGLVFDPDLSLCNFPDQVDGC